ncbi:MAG TPA: hypothetical protein VFQ77_11965 [Pseudonocardiaceae bacterium]|nr:hypothetical protein [Pseudonocardiaceae bacterium]
MTGWPRWSRATAPGALAHYVHRDAIAPLLPRELAAKLPGPSAEPPMWRAQRIYQVFAQHPIHYVDEPTSSEPGRQAIRPPDQVFTGPRAATCLDLAVTFAGACLDAGLHPMIVILDSARGGPSHALVLVWLGGSWPGAPAPGYPWRVEVHHSPPGELVGQVRAGLNEPGAFLAIDVAAAARQAARQQDDAPPPSSWEAAIAAGADMLTTAMTGGAWRWDVAVDVGVCWRATDVHPLPQRPLTSPLVEPYLEPEPDAGPLAQLRARRTVVPFYGRDELDVLLDWCQNPQDTEHPTRVAVVHGVGGAGKTHLAAELAHRLAKEGWYTGFLTRDPDPADLSWLATVVQPLLVVVDYPEDVRAETVVSLLTALRGRSEPACVVLTARKLGTWWTDITKPASRDGVSFAPGTPLELPLPPRHPSTTGVFQRALRAFAQLPGMAPAQVDTPPAQQRWTTLDLVMLAWLAAHGAARLPTTPETLYDEILDREFDYWTRVCRSRGMSKPPRRLLRAVGACVTLLAPTPDRIADTLCAVDAFDRASQSPDEIAEVVETLLPPDGDTVAIRPDPVGERLVLRELGTNREFLARCLESATEAERLNACLTISRSAERNRPAADQLAATVLAEQPGLWQAALAVVAAQGGPFGAPLLALADHDDSPLPLAQLAETVPLGHAHLRTLALIATQRTRPPDPTDPTDLDAHARVAAWWNNLSNRQSETGDRVGALDAITEAVGHYRRLAEANPAAFLPDLATALNNLARLHADAGELDRAAAAFDAAWTDLAPGPRAELAVQRARWWASRDDLAGAISDLGRAAAWAEQETDTRWAGRSRRAVRDAVAQFRSTDDTPFPLSELPGWAWQPLPEDVVATLDEWLAAADWATCESLIRAHADLWSGQGRETLRLAQALYPEVEALTQLGAILDAVAAHGLDQVLADLRSRGEHAELLEEWLATETWSQSRDFLHAHPELATDPRTIGALEAGAEDPVMAQHLGIARLTTHLPLADVYDTVTDHDIAVDTAMGFVENGEHSKLGDLLLAAPHLLQVPYVTPFLLAVYTVLGDATPAMDPAALMRTAAEQGSDTQRAAGAARLRRLVRRRPAQAQALLELANILTAPAPDESTPDPDTAATSP